MASPHSTSLQDAYKSLMTGLAELKLDGPAVPCDLVLTGDNAFPLAMNSHGQVLMAASVYGSGRIVVFGHESHLSMQQKLVENAVNWLKKGKSPNASVGVHKNAKKVEENLKSSFKTKTMNGVGQGVAVYVTDAQSVAGDEKDIVAFIKSGGGVLIAGQAWHWGSQNPKRNPLLEFPGNKVSGVAGIYFSQHKADAERIPVYPEIPVSWMSVVVGKDFEDDLNFLLQGISEFDLKAATVSEILLHGSLAFPIGTRPDGRTFLAGAYYGQGRVVLVSHEGLLWRKPYAAFWKNALHWLDEGRQGEIGVDPGLQHAFNLYKEFDMTCKKTKFRKDLSVFVRTAYGENDIKEIKEFVAEGGGLLIGGHAWHWANTHKGKNPLTEFAGNKILNQMGMTLLKDHFSGGTYKAPVPSQMLKDTYHFRHVLHKFGEHVTSGEKIGNHEEEWLSKLTSDCSTFLHLDPEGSNYHQILCSFTDIIKKGGMPQVCESCPVTAVKDRVLLSIGTELYKVCPNRDELLPYFIKNNPILPVVYNHRISVNVNTKGTGRMEWVSTGLYLSPGMKTYMSMPAEIVDKGWEVQIGCQTDKLNHKQLKRAPCVHHSFKVTSEMMLVFNLWGGLIYLIAPAGTKVTGAEVVVQMAVPAPYYKSGVTSKAQWRLLRTAPSPWAELEFENIILTVPSDVIRDFDDVEALTAHWDVIMRAVADLAAKPPKFDRKERIVCDVQIAYGFLHAGYPIMAHSTIAKGLLKHDKTESNWGAIHELGHNQQRGCWEFRPHTTECTCNLWSLYVHHTVYGFTTEQCHPAIHPEKRRQRLQKYVNNGKQLKDWNTFVAFETYLQVIEKFGWDPIKKVMAAYHTMKNVPNDNKGKMNLYVATLSETVGRDLTGFFKAWGLPIEGNTEKKMSKLPAWNDHPMAHFNR